jgi:hypothetical protein
VTSAINEEKTWFVIFPRGQLVGDFLNCVREQIGMPDLHTALLDGMMLEESDCFDDWYVPDIVFRVVDTELRWLRVTDVINQDE